ncbi:MAG: cytidine deaminase [Deltaproteobacteria bacterium]|nr:cytidine deaminase [Deltaproteobacteria bacterium]
MRLPKRPDKGCKRLLDDAERFAQLIRRSTHRPFTLSESRYVMRQLLASAHRASKNAHCPYSRFHVGAAAWDGASLFVGCNVENASYGLTQCAERVALTSATAQGARRIRALALVTPDNSPKAVLNLRTPCGACRQVMIELMDDKTPILIEGAGIFTLKELLPNAFRLK